eukprot:scaffold314481_cov22-Tisochrysis_lutea.AAC.1
MSQTSCLRTVLPLSGVVPAAIQGMFDTQEGAEAEACMDNIGRTKVHGQHWEGRCHMLSGDLWNVCLIIQRDQCECRILKACPLRLGRHTEGRPTQGSCLEVVPHG